MCLLLSGYFTELQWAPVWCILNYGCDPLMVCEVILVDFDQLERGQERESKRVRERENRIENNMYVCLAHI